MTTPITTSTADSQMHNNIMAAGPYTPSTVTISVIPATDESSEVPEQTAVKAILNITHEMWIAIERLQHGESLKIQDAKTNLFWEFGKFTSHDGESMESYYSRFYKMINEMIRNNLTVATMQVNIQFLQQLQPEWSRSLAQPSKQPSFTRSNASTKYKGTEIAKPITPPSESASEEDSDLEQDQRDKDMQKNLTLISKYFEKIYKPTNNNLRTSSNFRNKNVDTSPRYKNDNQTGQFRNQMTVTVAGVRETVGMEEVDSNVIPDSLDLCNNDIQTDQNAEEYDDERVALANLIANLTLDTKKQKGFSLLGTLFLRFTKACGNIEVLKDFLKIIQRNLQAQLISVRSDRGTKFLNKTLHDYFKEEGIAASKHLTPKTPFTSVVAPLTETFVDNNTFKPRSPTIKGSDYDNSGPVPQLQNISPSIDTTALSQQEFDLLFGPLYDEFFTVEPTTPTTNDNAEENNDNQATDTQFQQDEIINPFCTPVRDVTESSSRNTDNSNMHTFYQPHDSEYRWTKDHPLRSCS
ncbi:hypothetical protein Tco_1166430 [Tanacetum coccineum]